MRYVLGLDLGTTHAKVIAMSSEGEILYTNRQGYDAVAGLEQGFHEFIPDDIRNAAIQLLLQAMTALAGYEPASICISAAMHSLMLVDEKGKPLTNLITWADLRSSEQARKLKEEGVAIELYKKTGTPVHPMSPFCKILWLKEHRYKTFKAAHKFIGCKEYLIHYLCGSYLVDHGIASATGLFNIKDKCWDVSILKRLEVSAAQLPATVPVSYQVKVNNRQFLAQVPGLNSISVIAGSSDGALANLGSGAIGENRLSITVGTSGAVRKVVSKRTLDQHAANFCYVFDDKQFITGGPINNAGNLLRWFSDSMSGIAIDQEQAVDDYFLLADPSCQPIFLPYIQGERAPVWDADAKGIFFGINSSHAMIDFQHAVGESICYSLRQLVEQSDELHGKSETIILSGGLSRSVQFVRLLATVLNRPISVADDADASAIGACILGWKVLGTIQRYEELLTRLQLPDGVQPEQNLVDTHSRRFNIFKQLYAANKVFMHQPF